MFPRPLRVAMLSYYLPTSGKKRGGIERVAHELGNGLVRRGHKVSVWSYDPPPRDANYQVLMLPWKRFASTWLGQRLIMGYLGNLLSLLPSFDDYDVVIAHGDSLMLPLRRKTMLRVMHGSALGEALSAKSAVRIVTQLGVYVQELLTGATQVCVGVSENTRKYNPFLRHVIPNGVSTQRLGASRREKSPYPSILFVGALSGRKRGALLLRWFTELVRPRHPSAELVVVGEVGPPLEGVTYQVGIDDDELVAQYQRAWIYASPSTYEGFGLPYMEAMASGTPVVATPNPGSIEVLGCGKYGLLAHDEEFGSALNRLLDSERLRNELAEAGLRRAQHYSLERMIDGYEKLLFQMMRARGAQAN